MEQLGFFLVHRFADRGRLRHMGKFLNRPTRTFFPKSLRYEIFDLDDGCILISWRGDWIYFQRLQVEDWASAQAAYQSPEKFNSLYGEALRHIEKCSGRFTTNSRDSFLLQVGAAKTAVSWETVRIPTPCRKLPSFQLLCEALLVEGAKSRARYSLSTFDKPRVLPHRLMPLLEISADLAQVGQPEDFLVVKDEIEFMRIFYKEWSLETSIEQSHSAISQVISNFGVLYARVQSRRSLFLNFMVLALALAGIIGSVDSIMATGILGEDSSLVVRALFVSSVTLGGSALIALVGGQLVVQVAGQLFRWSSSFLARARFESQASSIKKLAEAHEETAPPEQEAK